MNPDPTPDPSRQSQQDLQWLRDHLNEADPAADLAEQSPSIDRLESFWQSQCDREGELVEPLHPDRNGWRGPRTLVAGLLTLATALLLTWWWSPWKIESDPATTIAQGQRSEWEKQNPEGDTVPPTLESVASHNAAEIQSVKQLLDLPPRLVRQRLKQSDQDALSRELQQWLKQWYLAQPEKRRQLESDWTRNRQFWLAWSMQSVSEYPDPEVRHAALELISLDLGNQAFPFLQRCLADARLASAAMPYWINLAEDQQLIARLYEAQQCDVIQQVLQELVQRPSGDATEALSRIASQSQCRFLLAELEQWNPIHWQRAVEGLEQRDPEVRFRAAMLMAAIPDQSIDRLLLTQIERGVGVLPATSVLLLRDRLETLQQAPNQDMVRTAMVSARQQVARWNQWSQKFESVFSKEVCKRCEENS